MSRRHLTSLCTTVVLVVPLLAFPASNDRAEEAAESDRSNRLAQESSPYLLLHADNPVDWYPWGEEAIAKAREEDKPIFLSVGYSTCYWCHVMERKVFSDPEIAELMNRWFVSIKVDREERPELDEIYMTATRLLTKAGGWPNSVFLTPDLEPFFAGTYFPPEDRAGKPGFPTVLRRMHQVWTGQREQVISTAEKVSRRMEQVLASRGEPSAEVPPNRLAHQAVEELKGSFDETHGGFGRAPKFPSPGKLLLLWQAGDAGSEEHRMVLETLGHMGRGGIYDQVGGGFHRYSTDARWLVPHFEKMLYDNAFLAELLALGWREAEDPELERFARGTLDFVLREMTLPNGAFKSAINAETDGEEGAYYVWTEDELREALDEDGFRLLAPVYGFDDAPNFEGDHHILHLTAPLAEHAARLDLDRDALLARIEPHLDRLLEARSDRERPLVDDKVLADWNGMMIAAMARAGSVLDEPRYVEAAERGAGFLLENLEDADGTLRHAWRDGEAKIDAFLGDYAFLVRGLLALHDATGEERWLEEAGRLADQLEDRLAAPDGGYYQTASRPSLLVRPVTVTGGAIPSANAVMVHGLLELADKTGEERFRNRAERALKAFAVHLERFSRAVPMLAAAALRYSRGGEPEDGRGPGEGPASEADAAPGSGTGAESLEGLARRVDQARARAAGGGARRSSSGGWRATPTAPWTSRTPPSSTSPRGTP